MFIVRILFQIVKGGIVKLPILIIIASVGAGLFLSNLSHNGISAASISGPKEGSIAAHCARAVPELLDEFAKEPDLKDSAIKRLAANAVFKQVGNHFCQCADDDFTPTGAKEETEIVGNLAGLFLKLHFSNGLSREYRGKLKTEGQAIFLANESVIRTNPDILNGTKGIFEGCRKKQQDAIRSITG